MTTLNFKVITVYLNMSGPFITQPAYLMIIFRLAGLNCNTLPFMGITLFIENQFLKSDLKISCGSLHQMYLWHFKPQCRGGGVRGGGSSVGTLDVLGDERTD
jgi:hypothetical protein